MVLSKMQGAVPTTGTSDVVAFLREFKALECSCCDQLIGFQHRITGTIFCAPDCAGKNGVNGHHEVKGNKEIKEMVSASTIQKGDVNPFYKNIPSARPGDKGKTREQIVDEELQIVDEVEAKPQAVPKAKPAIPSQNHLAPAMQAAKPKPLPVIQPLQPKPLMQPLPGKTGNPIIRPANVEDVTDSIKSVAKPATLAAVSSPAPARATPEASSPSRKNMWENCTYSPSLKTGATVKASFIWNLSKVQVCANRDEKILAQFQDKLSEYIQGAAKKLTQVPVVNQMVLGEYLDDFYRARVTSISPDGQECRILFVDFGDAIKIKWSELFDISEELMKAPVWSVAVELKGVKKMEKKLKPSKKLHDAMYQTVSLELLEPLGLEKDTFLAQLWLDDENSLTKLINDFIASVEAAN